MSLADCIDNFGESLSAFEKKALLARARRYRKDDGFAPKNANIAAVNNILSKLREEKADIVSQIEAKVPKFSKKKDVPFDPTAGLIEGLKNYLAPRGIKALFTSGRIKVVETEKDLNKAIFGADAVLRKSENGTITKGAFDPKSKTSYLVAENVGINEIWGVLRHELGIHAGLEKMLGGRFSDLLNEVESLITSGDKAMTKARNNALEMLAPKKDSKGKDLTSQEHAALLAKVPHSLLMEETLAYYIQSTANEKQTLYQRVIAAVRAWAFKTGILKDLTTEDIGALVSAAVNREVQLAEKDLGSFERWISLSKKRAAKHGGKVDVNPKKWRAARSDMANAGSAVLYSMDKKVLREVMSGESFTETAAKVAKAVVDFDALNDEIRKEVRKNSTAWLKEGKKQLEAFPRKYEDLNYEDLAPYLGQFGKTKDMRYSWHNLQTALDSNPALKRKIKKLADKYGSAMFKRGKLVSHPIEQRTKPANKKDWREAYWDTLPKFAGFLRSLPQTFLDNMTSEKDKETFRSEIVRFIEDVYKTGSRSDLLDFNLQNLPGDIAVAPAVRGAEKTVGAINLNSMCPMFNIGAHGCYFDGCYVTGTAMGPSGINFYRAALYTGEILQLSNKSIKLLNKAGGLRVNGAGDSDLKQFNQWRDFIKHAAMRGLKLKVITKQDDTFEILSRLQKDPDTQVAKHAKYIVVQPSVDPYWIPVTEDDIKGSFADEFGIVKSLKKGTTKKKQQMIVDLYKKVGRDAKVINGQVHRKYGYSFKQLKALSKKYPTVKVQPRLVVGTFKEISEYALKTPEILQTWMHALIRPGMYSEVEGKHLRVHEEAPYGIKELAKRSEVGNFTARIGIVKRKGEWKVMALKKKGDTALKETPTYTALEMYIKDKYSKKDQDKIFSVLAGQLKKSPSALCCAVNASVDACIECTASCNAGTHYTGTSLGRVADAGYGVSRLKYSKAPPVKSKAFKKWFSGSVVVEPDGSPMVVYHGTDAVFDQFKTPHPYGDIGYHFGSSAQANEVADGTKDYPDTMSPNIIPAYLSLQNPYDLVTDLGGEWNDMDMWREVMDDAEVFEEIEMEGWESAEDVKASFLAKGYDGIKYQNSFEGAPNTKMGSVDQDAYIAFNPNQIKSVFNAQPTADPRIMYSKAVHTEYKDLDISSTWKQSLTKIRNYIESNDAFDYGIRNVVTDLDKRYDIKVPRAGAKLGRSYVWDDNDSTGDRLEGTAAFAIEDTDDIPYILSQSLEYQGTSQAYHVLLQGVHTGDGGMPEDSAGLFENAIVIAVFDNSGNILSSTMDAPPVKFSKAWTTPQQKVSSAGTSLSYPDPEKRAPIIFGKFRQGKIKLGRVNADIGGGKYDQITKWLKKKGVINIVHDRFNRDAKHNDSAERRLRNGQADTATVSNVLNVIPEAKNREVVIASAADALKPGGTAFFSAYNKPTDKAKTTKKADRHQEARTLKTYLPEIQKYFPDARVENGIITAVKDSGVKFSKGLQERIDVADSKGYDIVTHVGWEPEVTPRKSDGVFDKFDGVFGSYGEYSDYGNGNVQTRFAIKEDKIARHSDIDLDYDKTILLLKEYRPELNNDQLDRLYDLTAMDKSIWDNPDDNPLHDFGFEDTGGASWRFQNIRGKIAIDQGFDAIEVNDEFGTSVFIPHGSKAKHLTDSMFDPKGVKFSKGFKKLPPGFEVHKVEPTHVQKISGLEPWGVFSPSGDQVASSMDKKGAIDFTLDRLNGVEGVTKLEYNNLSTPPSTTVPEPEPDLETYKQGIPDTPPKGRTRLYRATDGASNFTEVDIGTSWTESMEGAKAYTENSAFGGDKVFQVDIPTKNILDLRTSTHNDREVLARAVLGEDATYGEIQDLVMGPWKHWDNIYKIWETDHKIFDKLTDAGYEWVAYFDDFPDGMPTYVPLKDFKEQGHLIYNKDVKFSKAPAPKWRSQLADEVRGLKQKVAPAGQWMGMIRKLPVKQAELKWVGLEEWLATRKGKVTKDDVLQYLAENDVQVEEVVKGGPTEDVSTDETRRLVIRNIRASIVDRHDVTQEQEDDLEDAFSDYEWGDREALDVIAETTGWFDVTDIEESLQTKGTTFGQWQVPGGTDYKELYITWPGLRGKGWKVPGAHLTGDPKVDTEQFVRIRFNTRTVGDSKVLFLEEVQDDINQAGRAEGFKSDEDLHAKFRAAQDKESRFVGKMFKKYGGYSKPAIERRMNPQEKEKLDSLRLPVTEAYDLMRKDQLSVPDHPFRTNAMLVAFKRMVRYAAENGYDSVAWTPGQIQADRYDLSKHFSSVVLHDNVSGGIGKPKMEGEFKEGTVKAFDHSGNEVIDKFVRGTSELEATIGKEATEKILNAQTAEKRAAGMGVRERKIEGLDLKVGGEKLKVLYDKKFPNILKDYFGKATWGKARVGSIEIVTTTKSEGGIDISKEKASELLKQGHEVSGTYRSSGATVNIKPGMVDKLDLMQDFFVDYYQAKKVGISAGTKVHNLPVTQEMRDKALTEGMVKFSKAPPTKSKAFNKMFKDTTVRDASGVDIESVINSFKDSHDAWWYKSGGCYEFTLSLGRFLEKWGDTDVAYFSYGSKAEPDVHTAIKYKKKFYDIGGEFNSLDDLIQAGDYYFDTKDQAKWTRKKKSNIPMQNTSMAEIKKNVKEFESIFNAEPTADPRIMYSKAPAPNTPAFKKMFKDTKVVDAQGQPLVVYHGTPRGNNIEAFKLNHPADGIYFSVEEDYASGYGREHRAKDPRPNVDPFKITGDTLSVYLNIKKPLVTKDEESFVNRDFNREDLIAMGYDGVVLMYDGKIDQVMAFNPNQIKSIFNAEPTADPRIMYSKSMGVSPVTDPLFGGKQRTLKDALDDLTTDPVRKALGWSATNLADRLDPIRVLGNETYMLHRMQGNIASQMAAFFQHGMFRWDGNGLAVDKSPDGGFLTWYHGLKKDGPKFLQWVAAKRAIELEKPTEEFPKGRENFLTREKRKAIFENTWAANDKHALALNKQFKAFNSNILDIAEQAGVISAEGRAQWEQEFYIPFYRMINDEATIPDELILASPSKIRRHITSGIKQLKGGEADLGDPMENIIRNWTHLINESMRNLSRSHAFEAGKLMGLIRRVPKKFLSMKNMTTLSFLRDGKSVYFQVQDAELFNALSEFNHEHLDGMLAKIFGYAKGKLTWGVTMGPAFRIANMIRDTLSTGINSPHFIPFIDSFRGFIKIIRKHPDFIAYAGSGGAFTQGYVRGHDPQAQAEYIMGLKNKTGKNIFKGVYKAWQYIGDVSEMMARVQLYSNVKKVTGSHLKASFEAKDIMDFTMKGASKEVTALTNMIPFMNARIQGLYRLGRGAKEHPVSFLTKGTLLAMASMALWSLFKDDDRYIKLTDYEKWLYHHWWIGDKHFRLPKGFETGLFFSSVPEVAGNIMNKTEEGRHIWDFIGHAFSETLAMNPVPQAIKPMAEVFVNKNFFTGRDIEGVSLEGRSQGLRYDPWTKEAMKALGEKLGISPKKAEHVVRGYLGSFGAGMIIAADMAYTHVVELPDRPSMTIDQYPMIGRFYRGERVKSTKYGTRVWEMFRELSEVNRDLNFYKKNRDRDKVAELRKDKRMQLRAYQASKPFKRQLADVRAAMTRLWIDKNLSSTEKDARLIRLEKRRTKIQRQAYERLTKLLRE